MRVPDKALVQVGKFPGGLDNVSPQTAPPRDQDGNIIAARKLQNVDVDNVGGVQMRRGQVTIEDLPAHSLFAGPGYLYAWVDGELRAYRKEGATIALDTTLLTGLPDRFSTYTTDDFDVYTSNGEDTGHRRIAADLTVHPFWLDTPAPVDAVATSAGGLDAGNYEVAVTVVDADGRESGASDPVIVTLTAGQGIAVTFPPAPEDAVKWRVYRTTANGGEDATVMYLAQELPIIATAATLGVAITSNTLKTAWMFPLPPCTILCYWHGRLLGATADGLVWSESYRLGLMLAENNVVMYGGCRMIEALGDGSELAGGFISDGKRTYWYGGATPGAWRTRVVHPHPAVPGTSIVVAGSRMGLDSDDLVAVWASTNGTWLMGMAGGQVTPIRKDQVALPVNAERGAAAFFQNGGIAQMLTALYGGDINPMNAAMSDTASATIRRHGIELPDNDISP